MEILKKIFGEKSLQKIARKTGYVQDQMGILNRFVRENNQWKSHLDKTKQYIIESARLSKKKKSVAVLGSGWLLDVPIEVLTKEFSNVYLLDIVHPEQVSVNMKKYPNVHLVQCDITGGAVALAEKSKSFAEFENQLNELKIAVDLNQYDMVVSVNLLNQLDIILCDYLKQKFSVSDEQLVAVRTVIQNQHLGFLPLGKTCLITDYLEENTPIDGMNSTKKQLLYCSIPENETAKEWRWNFDTNQKYHKGCITAMQVKAVRF